MLSGITFGHTKPEDLQRWNTDSTCQWLDDFEDPKTTRPHIKLTILSGTKANEMNYSIMNGRLF
jgi:hypothetical protein